MHKKNKIKEIAKKGRTWNLEKLVEIELFIEIMERKGRKKGNFLISLVLFFVAIIF